MSTLSTLRIKPQKTPLKGTIRVPGDKSISHRAVLLAAIAKGTSTIRNWLPAGDTLATLEAVRALGVQINIDTHSHPGVGFTDMRPGLEWSAAASWST